MECKGKGNYYMSKVIGEVFLGYLNIMHKKGALLLF